MSEYQAWCLGAKVGLSQPTHQQAIWQVHQVGLILYPDNPKKRRAFEDLCQISLVVPLSSTQESATEVPITGNRFITAKQSSMCQCGARSQ